MQEYNMEKIFIKKAVSSDIKFLWHLRNQPEIFKYFKNPETVNWESHLKWIRPIIAGKSKKNIFIIWFLKNRAGQIRFDKKNNNSTEISISVLREFWGRGIARGALALAIKKQKDSKYFTACIHKDNLSSLSLFEKMNFKLNGRKEDWLEYKLILK